MVEGGFAGPIDKDLGPVLQRAGLLAHEDLVQAQGLRTPDCWLFDRKSLAAACHAAGYALKPQKDQGLVVLPARPSRRGK